MMTFAEYTKTHLNENKPNAEGSHELTEFRQRPKLDHDENKKLLSVLFGDLAPSSQEQAFLLAIVRRLEDALK